MGIPDPTVQWREGLGYGPSPYLRWGMVEEIIETDITQPAFPDTGGQEVFLAYARSLKVRWLHHAAGRSTVRFIEPWGVTSMPMVGSVVAVGFTGGTGGEPIVLGFWTQGYNDRIPGELGELRPGQEVWRRAGLRFRIVPRYTDMRKFPAQLRKSPWTLDLIMGEQHDTACFCVDCQTRYPSTEEVVDGKKVLTCPTSCPICGGKMRLVSGSVAPGEGDAWLAVQSAFLVDSVLNGVFEFLDENVLGENIEDIQTQQTVRNAFRRYLWADVRVAWGGDVESYFENELVSRWEGMLREYFTVGSLLNYADDASGLIDSTLVAVLIQTIDGWILTQLQYYLTEQLSDEDRNELIAALRENLNTYVTEFVPGQIEASARAFIDNKARIYLTETVTRLRRKAINWLYKSVLKKLKDKALKEIRGRLQLDFGGLRAVRDAVAQYSADKLAEIAEYDLVKLMNELLEEGLQDPEELPVMELRLDQDLRSIVNLKTGIEEGQGQKAARLRLKLYRTGEMHLQIREDIFLLLNADGSVDLSCTGPLSIDAPQMTIGLEEDSAIYIENTLRIGHPGVPMKRVTLDADDVREFVPGTVDSILGAVTAGIVGGVSTRQFVERVAWRYITAKLQEPDVLAGIVAAADDGGALFVAALTRSKLMTPNPHSNSVIGKTDASADHLQGN